MTKSEAISILLKYAYTEKEVTKYIATTIKFGEGYFQNFNEERLLTDFNAKKYSA